MMRCGAKQSGEETKWRMWVGEVSEKRKRRRGKAGSKK